MCPQKFPPPPPLSICQSSNLLMLSRPVSVSHSQGSSQCFVFSWPWPRQPGSPPLSIYHHYLRHHRLRWFSQHSWIQVTEQVLIAGSLGPWHRHWPFHSMSTIERPKYQKYYRQVLLHWESNIEDEPVISRSLIPVLVCKSIPYEDFDAVMTPSMLGLWFPVTRTARVVTRIRWESVSHLS